MKAPKITREDVDAVEKTLQVMERLEEYARHEEVSAVNERKMKMAVGMLAGIHDTLSAIHYHQKKKANHQLDTWSDT